MSIFVAAKVFKELVFNISEKLQYQFNSTLHVYLDKKKFAVAN